MTGVCDYDPRQHLIIHPQLETSLRSRMPDEIKDRVFVYFHRKHRNYVIGWWVKKGKSFIDSHNIGKSLANLTKHDFHATIRAIRNVDGKKRLLERLKRQHTEGLLRQQDEADLITDQNEFLQSTSVKVSV